MGRWALVGGAAIAPESEISTSTVLGKWVERGGESEKMRVLYVWLRCVVCVRRAVSGWWLLLLFLQAACTQGPLRLRPNSEHAPAPVRVSLGNGFTAIQVSDTEFREAFTRLLLEVPLKLAPRAWAPPRDRFVRASWDSRGMSVEQGYLRECERRGFSGDCFSLLARGPSDDTALDARGRFTLGFIFALTPAAEAALGVLSDFSTQAMTAVLCGLSLYLLVLMTPEPISKGIAATMTLFLWGYLGTELWGLISATGRLWNETAEAHTFQALREASERYARVLGPNTLRLLLLLATWSAGAQGRGAMPTEGLPHFSQAIRNAASAGRIHLPTAASEVQTVLVTEGRLTLSLPSGSSTVLAMQNQGGGSDGEVHHIATVENEKSTARGGPWTQRLKKLFDKAGMSMEDPVNKVRIPGHKGPHPKQYHQTVYERLRDAVEACRTTAQCREALTQELTVLAEDLLQAGSDLNKLVTRSP